MEADLLEAVRAEIITQGLLITTSVEDLTREDKLTTVKTKHVIFDTESGEDVTVYSYGQGQDAQDKGSGKAITNAVKYFYMKTFMVESNNDVEDDGGTKPKRQTKANTTFNTPSGDGGGDTTQGFKPRTLSRGN